MLYNRDDPEADFAGQFELGRHLALYNRGEPGHRQDSRSRSSRMVEVHGFEEASALCREYITKHELSAADWLGGSLFDAEGVCVARVSYNGKVWPLGKWKSGDKPLWPSEAPEPASSALERSGDADMNPALRAQVQGVRGGMLAQAEKHPLPPQYSVEPVPDRAAVYIKDRGGRRCEVPLCSYGDVRQALHEFSAPGHELVLVEITTGDSALFLDGKPVLSNPQRGPRNITFETVHLVAESLSEALGVEVASVGYEPGRSPWTLEAMAAALFDEHGRLCAEGDAPSP